MLTVVEYIGAVLMITVGAAMPVLVIIVVWRSVRQQYLQSDRAKRRQMRIAALFSVLVCATSVAAMIIGLEAVVILAVFWLVVSVGTLPFIARADIRRTKAPPTDLKGHAPPSSGARPRRRQPG